MRVLQVDSGREWRGGQNQVRLLCRELARYAEVEQVLVTQRESELARRAAADGASVRGTAWDIGLDPRAWWHLRRTISSFQPDIIHVHDSHALTLAATVTRRGARRLVASRRVDFHVSRFGAWRRPDRIIAVSDAPLDIRSRLRLSPQALLAVNAAALVDHKDHLTLIRAARAARTLEPQLHWVIAGEGPQRDALAAEITRLDLQDRVHLVGWIDRIEALIAEASVFVMSSKLEGLGSVILNALALQRPVVATAAGGIPEILPPDVLVPPGGADALARRVVDMLRNPQVVPFPPRFTARSMADRVLEVYRALP
jgi:hypothetical protein